MGAELSIASGGTTRYRRVHDEQKPGSDHDQQRIHFAVWPQRLFKTSHCSEYLARDNFRRELFDFAFKEYAMRWKFKRPMPADFFRTMEDASGVDLDWFWRGWFYSNDHVDLAVTGIQRMNVRSREPEKEEAARQAAIDAEPESMSKKRNKDLAVRTDKFSSLIDFYNTYDPGRMEDGEREYFRLYLRSLTDEERKILNTKQNFYLIDFKNIGGLVMPLIVEAKFEDGSSKVFRFPAEIWRKNNQEVSKLIITEKVIESITLDPYLETADVDLDNNSFPPQIAKSRFDVFRSRNMRGQQPNPMRVDRDKKEAEERRERAEKRRQEAEEEAAEKAAQKKAERKAKAEQKAKAEAERLEKEAKSSEDKSDDDSTEKKDKKKSKKRTKGRRSLRNQRLAKSLQVSPMRNRWLMK